jgi:hypothetical protein
MRAKKVNEDIMFNDPGSEKALSGWAQQYLLKDQTDYFIETEEPLSILVSSVDKDKLSFILNKYRVPFKVNVKN